MCSNNLIPVGLSQLLLVHFLSFNAFLKSMTQMKSFVILALCFGASATHAQNVGIGITPTAKLHVNGTIKMEGNNMFEFGGGVVGKEVNAGKIGYNAFGTNSLEIVGAGTNAANRQVYFFAEAGTTFNGPIFAGGSSSVADLNVGGRLTTVATGANHLLPICYGTINGTTATILNGTGNFRVTKIDVGRYAVIIEGVNLSDNNYTATVTCQKRALTDGAFFWTFPGVSPSTPPTGSLYVVSSNGDQIFSFVVYTPN
jgi:hypothetical protein